MFQNVSKMFIEVSPKILGDFSNMVNRPPL